MGTGSSVARDHSVYLDLEGRNRQIDKDIEADRTKKDVKLLLLGPANSGKSTILKQLRIIHDSGFSDSERILQRPTVFHNMLSSMVDLVDTLQGNDIILSSKTLDDLEAIVQFVQTVKASNKEWDLLPDLIHLALENISCDNVILEALENLTMVDSNDNALYFFKDIKRIISPGYIPTTDDILRIRTHTAGVVQYSIIINKYSFNVIDVGGQKTQRRKWIHVFDNVNAVLFISSLSDYNETLEEDPTINCMKDSHALFNDICSSQWFDKTQIILFLNKIDLFEKKITRIPINVALKNYRGKQEYRPSLDYITRKFKQCNKKRDRKIYIHETCATDTSQVQVVIDMVVSTVIDKAMHKMGLK